MSENKEMVIMQVLPELITGGVERGTVEVAQFLASKGIKNIVVSQGGPMVRELDRVGVKHYTLPVKSKNLFVMKKNAKALESIILENKVDIVHARSRAPAWSAKWAAEATGVHFVTTFHGTYGLGVLGAKKAYNKVMTQGERVIAISNFIAEHMMKHYKTPKEKIKVVHRCVDLEKFSPDKVSAERIIQLATAWRVPEDKPIIMLPGRLTRWKGQFVLLEALTKMERRDFRCLLVGSAQGRDYYKKELESYIVKNNLEDVVHVTENCNDMPACYMLSDIVVSASTDPEAFGRVAIEGQSMGRIVVASNHGGSTETVKHGETGRLVPPSDSKALAEALNWALSLGDKERKKITEKAIKHVRENFSKDLMCKNVLELYEEVMSLNG